MKMITGTCFPFWKKTLFFRPAVFFFFKNHCVHGGIEVFFVREYFYVRLICYSVHMILHHYLDWSLSYYDGIQLIVTLFFFFCILLSFKDCRGVEQRCSTGWTIPSRPVWTITKTVPSRSVPSRPVPSRLNDNQNRPVPSRPIPSRPVPFEW